MVETVGFIGLGALGAPVATNLLDAGYGLRVHNRTRAKADPLLARGAEWAEMPADAAPPGGIVATLLWDDASVEGVVRSEAFLERLGDGVHISLSTISPQASRALAALHARHGSQLVEAPIFGVPAAAAARQLWMPYAGAKTAKARVQPLLEAMGAQGVFDFGEEVGAATTVKLAGKALSLAKDQGVEPQAVVDMLTATLFPAPIYQNYGRSIAQGKATVHQSPVPGKDLSLFRRTAEATGSPTRLTDLLIGMRRAAGAG